MSNDQDLQKQVEKQLSWEPGVHGAQIGVVAKEGAIHLAGHVDTFWEKCAAETAAWRVAHVKSVTNELRVDVPFSSMRADDDIALAAMGWLESNCQVPDTVEVQVADAWLTLNGDVEWQYQKLAAQQCMSFLQGIKGIRNEIVIRTTAPIGDVKASIEEAFKRNALLHAGHIKCHVSHGAVSLHGVAHSRAERDEAMHAAWSTPGIAAVEDHITIGSTRGG